MRASFAGLAILSKFLYMRTFEFIKGKMGNFINYEHKLMVSGRNLIMMDVMSNYPGDGTGRRLP